MPIRSKIGPQIQRDALAKLTLCAARGQHPGLDKGEFVLWGEQGIPVGILRGSSKATHSREAQQVCKFEWLSTRLC